MGLISAIFGGGAAKLVEAGSDAATDWVEVRRGNQENREVRKAELETAYIGKQSSALSQLAAEYANPSVTWFDSFTNGMNRLMRPTAYFGVVAMFVYAAYDPVGFERVMLALSAIPEQLWWMLTSIIGFLFGARPFEKGHTAKLDVHKATVVADMVKHATSAPITKDNLPRARARVNKSAVKLRAMG